MVGTPQIIDSIAIHTFYYFTWESSHCFYLNLTMLYEWHDMPSSHWLFDHCWLDGFCLRIHFNRRCCIRQLTKSVDLSSLHCLVGMRIENSFEYTPNWVKCWALETWQNKSRAKAMCKYASPTIILLRCISFRSHSCWTTSQWFRCSLLAVQM